MKDAVAILFVLALVIISLPMQIGIGLVIVLTSGFPVFFSQKRIGMNGKPFFLYKFRTMRRNAEQEQAALRKKNEAHGPVFKMLNDPRFTGVGKFLAHTGLDELPQLFNVLHGDMALFGPRPLPVSEAAKLTAWQRKRHTIRPGIISPWVVNGYHTQAFDAWMKSDIAYIKKKSWNYDMRLALRTIKFLCRLLLREVFTSLTSGLRG